MTTSSTITTGLTPREYQMKISESAAKANTLVVLPTGLGKTVIALLVAIRRLSSNMNSKILLLAPTKPLVVQHAKFFGDHLEGSLVEAILTGEVSAEERAKLFSESRLVFATPEVIRNDVRQHKYSLREVCLVVFDEAHRCVRDYAYSEVAEAYKSEAHNPLILALTASPSARRGRIAEICEKLAIKNVEMRTEKDEDVKPYVNEVSPKWERLPLPAGYKEVSRVLRNALDERVGKLRTMRLLPANVPVSKRMLLELGEKVRQSLRTGKSGSLYGAIVLQAQAMSLTHAVELLETQGAESLLRFLSRLENAETRSSRGLAKDARIAEARSLASATKREGHPKESRLRELVEAELSANPDAKMIVFTQFRDSVESITSGLGKLSGVRPVRFVGQATRRDGDVGLSQSEQVQILKDFREGKFNVLVTTSIGEEGLHVPDVDHVIFYEAVPSEIRLIQRRGRTGRTRPGKMTVLMSEGTIDEAYYWSSKRKEQQMQRILETVKRQGPRANVRKKTLLDYA